MDRVIIDTHVLVSLFIENSPYFEEAKEIVKDKVVYIPINILLEFIFLTVKRFRIDEKIVWEKLDEIHKNAIILEVSEKDLLEAYLLLKNYNLSLKNIDDAIIIVLAKKLNLTLITFDKRLKRIAENEGIKVYPT